MAQQEQQTQKIAWFQNLGLLENISPRSAKHVFSRILKGKVDAEMLAQNVGPP